MPLDRARRRLPVVESFPTPKTRRTRWPTEGSEMRPAMAVWELTLACDQKCRVCGPRAGRVRPNELDTEEALKLVDELAELGVGEVVLIGGEAYLRNDVLEIIRAIRMAGMTCSMTTGGLNLTPERAGAMVEAGMQRISVSIDGLERSHDYLRGVDGSWKRAFEALAHARAAGADIHANTQINTRTRRELLALCDLLAHAGVTSWQMFLTMPHGGGADHPDLILQPHMLLGLFRELEQLVNRCGQHGITVFPGNNLGYFGPLEARLRRHQHSEGHYRGCVAGKTGLGIEADGTIKSCPSVGGSSNSGGNWRDHGLREIWERAPEMRYIERRTIDDLWGYCRECYYASTCMGGCTATSEPLLGRPGNNPFCHHRALEMDRMGLRERIEQVAAPPRARRPFDQGLFRVVREHKDPALRAIHGAVSFEEPRVSRENQPNGPGRPVAT